MGQRRAGWGQTGGGGWAGGKRGGGGSEGGWQGTQTPPLTPPPPVSPEPAPAAELPRSRPAMPTPAPATAESPEPLRPSLEQLPKDRPQRFDASLDALVRDGIVTPKERVRVRGSLVLDPVPGLRKQACGSGALSAEECRTGVVLRGRSRPDSETFVVPGASAPALALARQLSGRPTATREAMLAWLRTLG